MKLYAIATTIVALLLAISATAAGEEQEAATESELAITTDQAKEQQSELELLPVSEPPIKLVHVLNPGEREYLSPNLIGVQNIAMTFLPLSMNFVNVIDAYREIVNGVRYEILLNAMDTKDKDADIICRLVILEKPWLRTQWGDKYRELVNSNCTDVADNQLTTDAAERGKALNDKYVSNTIFNGGRRNELSDDEMAQLEAQIMPAGGLSKRRVTTPRTTTTSSSTESSTNEPTTAISADEEEATATTEAVVDGTTQKSTELNDNEKQWLDDFLTVGAYNFEKSMEAATGTNDGQQPPQEDANNYQEQEQRFKRSSNDVLVGDHKPFDAKQAEAQLQRTLDKLTSGDGPHYKIEKVYSASRQVVSGTLTRIDADLINSNDEQHRCLVLIWSQPWLPEGHDVTFKCKNQPVVRTRHSRSVEWAEKKTHKKHNHHTLDKVEHLFHKFQIKYERSYATTQERQMRLRIFRQNLRTIKELNENEMGSAKYGITEFADMTSTEYKERTGLWQRDVGKATGGAPAEVPVYEGEVPKDFDWRQKKVVTEVKNQGSCGSCWAFSVTGNIEGLYALKTGNLQEFSEQELLDCDTIDGACNGGLPDNAYKAIKDIGGLEYESEYPYAGKKNQCHFNRTLAHVQVSGFVDLPHGNETAMQQWLLTNGPISIGINANAMQFYRGGVSHPWKALCSKKNLDHGVLIVGYGVSDYPNFHKTLPYWIVKNSWGPRWGEQGYYRVYRGDNTCGVSEMATSAVLA